MIEFLVEMWTFIKAAIFVTVVLSLLGLLIDSGEH